MNHRLLEMMVLTEIEDRLNKRIDELQRFLKEMEEARAFGKESNTLKISPVAGIFEKAELQELKKIRGDTE